MKHISKIFLVIALSIFLIKPATVQAGGGEEIVVDVDGTVIENVGTDNKEYPVKESTESDDRIKSDSRQFITFKTKDEKMFYLIIDHDKEQDNVKLLTDVKESDLESLVKEKDKTPVVKQEDSQVNLDKSNETIKQEEVKKEEPKTKSSLGSYIVLGGVILLVIGVGYYFKVVKPKKDKEKYNEEEEEDDFFSEGEDEERNIDENDKYE